MFEIECVYNFLLNFVISVTTALIEKLFFFKKKRLSDIVIDG